MAWIWTTRHRSQDSLPVLISANCWILSTLWIPIPTSSQSLWTAIHSSSNPWAFPTHHQQTTQITPTAMLPHRPTPPAIADLHHSMNPDYPPLATVTCNKSKHSSSPTTFTVAITTTRDHSSSSSNHWQIPIHPFPPLRTLFQCFETEWHSHHLPPCTTIRKLDRNSEWSHSCSSKLTIKYTNNLHHYTYFT